MIHFRARHAIPKKEAEVETYRTNLPTEEVIQRLKIDGVAYYITLYPRKGYYSAYREDAKPLFSKAFTEQGDVENGYTLKDTCITWGWYSYDAVYEALLKKLGKTQRKKRKDQSSARGK